MYFSFRSIRRTNLVIFTKEIKCAYQGYQPHDFTSLGATAQPASQLLTFGVAIGKQWVNSKNLAQRGLLLPFSLWNKFPIFRVFCHIPKFSSQLKISDFWSIVHFLTSQSWLFPALHILNWVGLMHLCLRLRLGAAGEIDRCLFSQLFSGYKSWLREPFRNFKRRNPLEIVTLCLNHRIKISKLVAEYQSLISFLHFGSLLPGECVAPETVLKLFFLHKMPKWSQIRNIKRKNFWEFNILVVNL